MGASTGVRGWLSSVAKAVQDAWRAAAPPRTPMTPDAIFPALDEGAGLAFTAIKEIAVGTPGFLAAGYQSGHLQWADVLPPGVNATYPHGLVLYYPWGETRNFPATADNPYGAIVGFVKTAHAPVAATLASDFANLANWRYAHMPTLCAAPPGPLVPVGAQNRGASPSQPTERAPHPLGWRLRRFLFLFLLSPAHLLKLPQF